MERHLVKFARMNDKVKLPSKRDEDAGLDIHMSPVFLENHCGVIVLRKHTTKIIDTGLKSILPTGYYINLAEKGGTGTLGMKYSAGIIDTGYTGEWMIPLSNVNDHDIILVDDYYFNNKAWRTECEEEYHVRGENTPIFYNAEKKAICQAILHKSPVITVEEVSIEDVANHITERGEGKLGSTDSK